jgi:hypothetical protein
MIRPQIKVTTSSSWALGWQVEHKETGDVLSHSGDNPGFKALAAASVSRKSGFIVMTNSDRGFEVIRKVVLSPGMQRFLPVAV